VDVEGALEGEDADGGDGGHIKIVVHKCSY
jgi:hypothetical protein